MKPVTGVIGCGSIARFHFSGLEKAGAHVKWVCDLRPEAAAPWAERLGARYTASYLDVTNDPEVELLLVNTVTSAHRQICLGAIAAGKAVVCEKTLADSPEDAAEIVEAANAKGTLFYTAYMKRFIPAIEKAVELLPSIGPVFSTYIRSYQYWGDVWEANPESGPFCTPPGGMSPVRGAYGGGILVCGGSHILDLIVHLLGRPSRLFASMYTPPDRDYDLLASALLETPNGVVHYETAAHPLGAIGFLRDGWDERIEINGAKGRLDIYSAKWDEIDVKASMLLHYDNASETSTEYRYPAVSPFDRAAAYYCRSVLAGQQGRIPRHTGYDVDQLIASIQRSASTGVAVDVEYRLLESELVLVH